MKTYQTHLPCPCRQCDGNQGTPIELLIVAEDLVDRHIIQAITATLNKIAQDTGSSVRSFPLHGRISVERTPREEVKDAA